MDTDMCECLCCETEGDCIEGICQNCALFISKVEKDLRNENKRYKDALEKLSRLGNEPHLGNSDGNKIAQQALNPSPERRK